MGHWASPQTQSRLLVTHLWSLRRHWQVLAVFAPACWGAPGEALVKAWPGGEEAVDRIMGPGLLLTGVLRSASTRSFSAQDSSIVKGRQWGRKEH